jgi:hypothetical protein
LALIATARYFGAGWVIAEWNSIKEFERDNKPSKVELVKADSPRCEELMGYIRGEKRQGSISGLRIRLTVTPQFYVPSCCSGSSQSRIHHLVQASDPSFPASRRTDALWVPVVLTFRELRGCGIAFLSRAASDGFFESAPQSSVPLQL